METSHRLSVRATQTGVCYSFRDFPSRAQRHVESDLIGAKMEGSTGESNQAPRHTTDPTLVLYT
jgi:hypothetical protein